ncbi:uncharacterized protein LOC112552269 [Pogonomyrmex barbatus]|uniref:Uncharacterized protein LOC112552269 n=1 Tax=Pogonomyrmex barbatus TaxID=144034 RepID=A0A8N1S4P3_9HYME|nr:uncharacterized protein LOC112552269 [Pogonomyrmex barbatus]
MIVRNVIAIIFFAITGTAFVQRSTTKRSKSPTEVLDFSHKLNNEDALLRVSDFGVVRRSLNPMLFGHIYSSVHLTDNLREIIPKSKVEKKKNKVIEKLKLSVTFRDNIFYIFSYLLHGREDGLTEEQYMSLQTLYEFLKKKMVYMYNLLPVLSKLDNLDKNQQTRIILLSMMKNLPSYLQCTAKYLANEIELKRIDLNMLLKPTAFETFNYLANIDSDMILKSKVKNDEEMIGFNKYSNITQKAVGPVFVKLLYNLHANKQPLSQELFGLILINLPNPSDDPILEENIKYLYELTKNNMIDDKSWNLIGKDPNTDDAYSLVFSVLTKILHSNVQMIVKDAAAYVYHHLKIVVVPSHITPNLKYMHRLIEKDIDIAMLLSAIIPQEFSPDAIRMKDHLLTYLRNYRREDLDAILKGFNKFAYSDPLNLLLAFLTRLANRIPNLPNSNLQMLRQSITALLPALIVKKYARFFTPFVSPEVDVLILLDSLKTPEMDPVMGSTIDSIKFELIAQPKISVLLSTLMPTEKDKCLIPKQCLLNTFQHIQRLQSNIPLTLITKIQNIAYRLKTNSPMLIPSQSFSSKPVDVNVFVDRKNPVAVAIDNMFPNNMISNFNKFPYVTWNINMEHGKIGPTMQVDSQPTEWETGLPVDINPAEIKVSPIITTDKAHVTKPQPYHYTISKKQSTFEDNPEIEHTPEMVLPKEISYPIMNEEIEIQTSSPEKTPTKIYSQKKPNVPYIESDFSERVKDKTSNENVSSAIVLPPLIKTDKPIKVQISNNGVPVVTTDDHNTAEPGFELPEISELLKPPEIDDLLKDADSPIVSQVLQPLSAIFGKNYVKKILKGTDTKLYSTNIALLAAILKKAMIYPEVAKNPQLMNLIQKYIATIEYVSPTILLPIVVSSMKLVSDIVYSTFNPNDLTNSRITENPPEKTSIDTITIPLVNPKLLLQSVNPSNPYADLLPTLKEGDVFAVTIRPLKKIFTTSKIVEILGPDFQPFIYPNKGALLITLLHKLRKSKTIQLNPKLKSIIDIYINAIEVPSMNIHVSEDNLVKMMSETTGQWQPELTSLMSALPIPDSDNEITMTEKLEQFLADPTLLDKLHIAKPPLTMTRGDLLRKIILTALSGKIHLERQVLRALQYYKNKIEFTEMGALPIMWMWVEMYVVKAEVQLGDMIQETINFNELTHREKLAYNDLITYLAQNPNLLQDNEDFDFEKYKTQGEFVRGLFKHLLKKPQVNNKIKRNIQMILPRVTLTGVGAIRMPNFSGFKK